MEDIGNKISVITICYNCRSDLEQTVNSVLAQTYANVEYIIVDGGSTDGTLAMMDKYRDRITTFISEHDDGIYDALNKGVRAATGEWIICMNAGDTFAKPTTLADVFAQQIADGTTVLYSDFLLCHADGNRTLRQTDRRKGEIHHQNIIYRRRLHETFGYYVVTHPYIVSDLLFFLAIPPEQFLKLPTPIALVKAGGVSDGQWCAEQAWAAKMIYGMDTIPGIFKKYLCAHAHLLLKGLLFKFRRP